MRSPSRLAASDHARIIALWEQAGLEHKPAGRDTAKAFADQLSQGMIAIGVENSVGELIGTVFATHDARKGWINRLAVHPDYRRRGVAQQLIEAAEAALHAEGLEIIAALIEPENGASIALFSAAGYSTYPGIVYMTKRERPEI
ncbi:MAG: GNAT family N-acetyltransferase [Chloroflexi bacterium]|nr:GNAT family N-acetyltransferase [Chloroflexota bacterium]